LLGSGVTPFALSALKYSLFALLILFIWRSTRWVVRGLTVESSPRPPRRRRKDGRKGGSKDEKKKDGERLPPGPRSIVVRAPNGAKPQTVRITASMIVGRAADCELHVEDTYASQQHARLFGKNGAWYVEDLGSTNGTFVNEQKLAAPAKVQPGDKIRIGTTILELRR
jgi:pSer/pThr/pTyr-binding forkhead associated (FHA) protein